MSTAQRKNFMKPEADSGSTLQKREEFAISLRKQKTKSIIQMKRRKIAESLSQRQTQNSENCGNIVMNGGTDGQIRPYQGYLPWKNSNEQQILLEKVLG